MHFLTSFNIHFANFKLIIVSYRILVKRIDKKSFRYAFFHLDLRIFRCYNANIER
nr:MAG TPA: hypothetical protein [Caudoviricetes sp.]